MEQAKDRRWLAFGVLGPAVAGAAVGFGSGLGELAKIGGIYAVLVLGVSLLTVPALYVGIALGGRAPSMARFGEESARSVADAGVVLLGVAPALLFLGATTDQGWARTMGLIALGAAALVGIGELRRRLEIDKRAFSSRVAFAVFSAVLVGLGAVFTYRSVAP